MARDLAELLAEVIARGYTHDSGSSQKSVPEIVTRDVRIVDSISFDGGTDPGDDVTMYLIETPNEKGYLIVSDSSVSRSPSVLFSVCGCPESAPKPLL